MASDDFILTLSDNDEAAIESEPEPEVAEPRSKKRKRGVQESKTSGKKVKVSRPTHKDEDEDEDEDAEGNWADHGEENGDIASDFEFVIGDTTGVSENFDGWGLEPESAVNGGQANEKKGVDLDAIISRRRNDAKEDPAAETNGGVSVDESGDEFNGIDDDELLAPDSFGMGVEQNADDDQESDGSDDEPDDEPGDEADGEDEDGSDDGSVAPLLHTPWTWKSTRPATKRSMPMRLDGEQISLQPMMNWPARNKLRRTPLSRI